VSPPDATTGPVIVLTYAYAGGLQVQEILGREHGMTCTTGTGILAACLQAARAWSKVEERQDVPLSRLAAASVRSMASAMLTTMAARTGRARWCEVATPEPEAAELFLSLFPGTRFLCMQRAHQDVVYAITRASPWGVGAGFAGYTATHPGSTVAALTAWWANHAGLILDFEQTHREACLRVRYEDLALDRSGTVAAIRAFLGLPLPIAELPDEPAVQTAPGGTGIDVPGCGAGFPADQLPAPLAERADELLKQLGYPPLAAR
jgi:sulfotransferase family protein